MQRAPLTFPVSRCLICYASIPDNPIAGSFVLLAFSILETDGRQGGTILVPAGPSGNDGLNYLSGPMVRQEVLTLARIRHSDQFDGETDEASFLRRLSKDVRVMPLFRAESLPAPVEAVDWMVGDPIERAFSFDPSPGFSVGVVDPFPLPSPIPDEVDWHLSWRQERMTFLLENGDDVRDVRDESELRVARFLLLSQSIRRY